MPGLTDAHTHASGTVPRVAKGAEPPLPGVAAHFLQAELRYGADTLSGQAPGGLARGT